MAGGGKRSVAVLLVWVLLALARGDAIGPAAPREQVWPVPYQRHESRPPSDPYCQASYQTFCPTGYTDGHVPVMDAEDTVEVFLLKAPVWEAKFGDLLAHFNIIHDAIGFRSTKTGLNYTSEWYELFELFNCTFPHILEGRSSPLWCNQGASCFYPGIDDAHWAQNGTLKKVAEMNGSQFNQLGEYIRWDNRTGLFYETWRVRDSTSTVNYTEWFYPFDCANYVMRAFQKMGELGAKFIQGYQANYTFITLYSGMPQYLGNETFIFGPSGNKTLADRLMKFYSYFQAHQPFVHFVESMLHVLYYVGLEEEFFLYYNSEYWLLPMEYPFVKITYEYVPFYTPKLA